VVNTGGGDDDIALVNSGFQGNVVANTASGNDYVTAEETRFGKKLVAVGGLGFDRLGSAGNTFERGRVVVLFEVQNHIVGPTAVDDAATLAEGGNVIVDLATNDTGNGDTLDLTSVVITDPPNNGLAIVNGNGTVTYTHDGSETTSDTFRYTIRDSVGRLSNEATVTLTVTPVNDPPTISDVVNQTTQQNIATAAIPFTVGDVDNDVATLTVTGSSNNTTLLPDANITFGGSGANRTVTLTPAAGQSGTATITLTVSDGALTATDTFTVTVNAPPTISNVADQTTNIDTPTGALAVTVGDAETPAGSLNLTGSSSNTALIPNANITFGGSGAARTVTITPAAGQTGTSTITLEVADTNGGTATDTFIVTVNALPTISDIADQTTTINTAVSNVPFTVGDAETPAASLTLTGSSTDTTLVPNANITFGGSGANRTVTITPAAGQTGTATITVTVDDGDGTASDTFLFTVNP
jgi:hypothetical protein